MRHRKSFNHLGRTTSHRKAMLSNMATSLILHKRISTTVTKAKELRKYLEPLITKAKSDTTHSRRIVFSYLGQKEAITELFSTVADKIADRPGGYTRIIKTGTRYGDNAETCIIELVDFNELYVKETKKKSTRRRTRKTEPKTDTPSAVVAKADTKIEDKLQAEETTIIEEAVVVEETVETTDFIEEVIEEPVVESVAIVEEITEDIANDEPEASAEDESLPEEDKKEE